MNLPASVAAPPLVDLDAYLARIGYDGPRSPTLSTLRALHTLHPAAIVFEAIDVLLDRGIDLAPATVDAKLIHARRGGYCFEHNSLFRRVLLALGFEVQGHAARVRWNMAADAPPTASTHMVLRVTIDGEDWIADVGFGSCVLTEPLRLDSRAPQPTQHEIFRLIPAVHGTLLEARLGERWAPVYELSPEPLHDSDYEMRNWYTSTHPRSHFRHQLIVTRTTPEARYTLLNNRYSIRRPDGSSERRFLDADGIERVLAHRFALPVQPDWRPVIERAASAQP